jgi:hypothetical protein
MNVKENYTPNAVLPQHSEDVKFYLIVHSNILNLLHGQGSQCTRRKDLAQ